ncbi:MAG: triose-phosphate isomerase [Proteobacteria bacterium]|nr:triose-phosphate isomerase [Pseudomonadota bacterium]
MNVRPPMIVANWKMNMDLGGVRAWCEAMAQESFEGDAQVVVCPSFVHILFAAGRLVALDFAMGAQDASASKEGAYTGQTSAQMLKDAGCGFCLVGHSERRAYCGETDAQIHEKITLLWQAGITPIMCVGETEQERAAGRTGEVLARQIRDGLPASAASHPFVIAYEPRWSIGTGVLPTLTDMEGAHAFIKECVSGHVPCADAPVLYGGSVTAQNAAEILAVPGVDGLLVGGASLNAQTFSQIVKSAQPPHMFSSSAPAHKTCAL